MRAHRLFALGVMLATFDTSVGADYPTKKSPPTEPSSPGKKKEYELPKTGKNIERQKGGWLNIEGTSTRFVVKFFDEKKKPVPPDVERGFARFNYAGKNDTRAPLNREGETLVTPATVRLPHNFLIILSLFPGEAEAVETYTFKYP